MQVFMDFQVLYSGGTIRSASAMFSRYSWTLTLYMLKELIVLKFYSTTRLSGSQGLFHRIPVYFSTRFIVLPVDTEELWKFSVFTFAEFSWNNRDKYLSTLSSAMSNAGHYQELCLEMMFVESIHTSSRYDE